MLRRLLLAVMVVILSFGLHALDGYFLYRISSCCSEYHLSLVVHYVCNPAIAVIVGALVGLLARNYPGPIAIIGLTPWMVVLQGPIARNGVVRWMAGFVATVLTNGVLTALTAQYVWRTRRSDKK